MREGRKLELVIEVEGVIKGGEREKNFKKGPRGRGKRVERVKALGDGDRREHMREEQRGRNIPPVFSRRPGRRPGTLLVKKINVALHPNQRGSCVLAASGSVSLAKILALPPLEC